jgi:hypothetical protein
MTRRQQSFSKYQRLLTHAALADFGWQKTTPTTAWSSSPSASKPCAGWKKQLGTDLKLKPTSSSAARPDVGHRAARLVERFGRLDDPLRVLLCSDVASEGLNLHYFCHRLVHFDLPWSLMVFQQRNGRVDRYGQKHQPHIVYLFTER